jgi:hypothetical protein
VLDVTREWRPPFSPEAVVHEWWSAEDRAAVAMVDASRSGNVEQAQDLIEEGNRRGDAADGREAPARLVAWRAGGASSERCSVRPSHGECFLEEEGRNVSCAGNELIAA